ncbi:MAG: ATP-binding protein [Pirellulaceae bacterium]
MLEDLNLTVDGQLIFAAVLLFGRKPQQFAPSAIVKCSHFHGTDATHAILSHQEIGGTLFEQVDGARDFVISRINRAVGPRNSSTAVDVTFEVPPGAVLETIVNAVAHRDYDASGSVQVAMFADRIEVISPGRLPEGLTPADLERPHASLPPNPFLARPLFLAGYIERLGVGILRVIEACRSAGLPSPTFEQLTNQFQVTLWRDLFTTDALAGLGVSERQKLAIAEVKKEGRITNSTYQKLAGVSRKTAARDLDDLVQKGVFVRVGEKRGTRYILATKK